MKDRVILNSSTSRNTLEARGPCILQTLTSSAVIRIDVDSGMTSTTISAAMGVFIGRRVLIGAGVLITDSNHHQLNTSEKYPRRFAAFPQPDSRDVVYIGDDVFLGARSIVLKGVTIGDGSVIGAGSVVTKDVPPMVVAAGNPCRIIRDVVRS